MIDLTCPQCNENLSTELEGLRCNSCGLLAPVRDGVPSFCDPPYWGEVDQVEMQALNLEAQKRGWKIVIDEAFLHKNPQYASYITDLNRTAWTSLVPVSHDATVLDVGSGLGAITHGLSLSYKHVVSMEAITERIEFQRIRMQQEGIDNVTLVQAGLQDMPFPAQSFDLIILNGVLEWIGEWDLEGSPRSAQLRALTKCLRLLRPGGAIMIGIENRWGFDGLRGTLDHSGLPYTQLLPRMLATLVLRLKKYRHHRTKLNAKRQYRTYTYGKSGYRKLLREAGFEEPEIFIPYHNYNRPHKIYNTRFHQYFSRKLTEQFGGNSGLGTKGDWRTFAKSLIHRLGLLGRFPQAFLVLGTKKNTAHQDTSSTLIGSVRDRLTDADLNGDPIPVLQDAKPHRNKRVILLSNNGSGPRWVVKVQNTRMSAEPTLNREDSALRTCGSLIANSKAADALPRLIDSYNYGPWRVHLETVVRGKSFANLTLTHRMNEPKVTDLIEVATLRAIELDKAMNSKGPDPDAELPSWQWNPATLFSIDPLALADELATNPASAQKSAGSSETLHLPGSPLAAHVLDRIQSLTPRIQHGDFFGRNIYLDTDSATIRVIDWEDFGKGYPPMLDLFTLWMTSYDPRLLLEKVPGSNAHALQDYQDLLFRDTPASQNIRRLSKLACLELDLNTEDLPIMLTAFLCVFIQKMVGSGNSRMETSYRERLAYLQEHAEDCVLGNPQLSQSLRVAQ